MLLRTHSVNVLSAISAEVANRPLPPGGSGPRLPLLDRDRSAPARPDGCDFSHNCSAPKCLPKEVFLRPPRVLYPSILLNVAQQRRQRAAEFSGGVSCITT
jgi:hypothetical protein